ncbi:hypothetical protein [uncultured Cohaesibacter sp.]|uniref:hypothetical protein n=1 Tax=uncultured Cohaesibacter sp. TaxID=1002546 RepID=UPI0029309ADE|nr:hypothetical protein [uncultured Cohaesibacter sp.]
MFTLDTIANAVWAVNFVFFGLMALGLLVQTVMFVGGFCYGFAHSMREHIKFMRKVEFRSDC